MAAEEHLPPTTPVERPEIVDPHHVQALFVDWIVTGGVHDNVVNLTLGTVDHSMKKTDGDLARVMIAARLCLSREFALFLHQWLGSLLYLPPPAGAHSAPPVKSPSDTAG